MQKVQVIPSALEWKRGVLRRTPRLASWEREGALIVRLEGWRVRLTPLGEEWYDAWPLYQISPPRPAFTLRKGEDGEVWAEARPTPPPKAFPAPKVEEERQEEKGTQRTKREKRVALREKGGRWYWEEGGRPPREALPLLLAHLGEEEFAPESVEPFLEHHGFLPREVWTWMHSQGLLMEEGGFWRIRKGAKLEQEEVPG